jgi:von Willebrand factor A domain-containing protein 8
MLMEALAGLEHKYTYEIVGHSGETHHLPLVEFGMPPRNSRERLAVVQAMVEHSAACSSGDNTLAAGSRAVRDVRTEEADDYFVFLISDANLEGYGVSPEALALALTSDPNVNAYAVFIAEPEVAREMTERMPSGRAHLVMENDGMPMLLKDIFSRALLSTRSSL